MAQVRMTPKSNVKWVALLAVLAAAGGLAWWKMSSSDDQASVAPGASVDAASAVSGEASQAEAGTNITDVVPEATSPAVVVAQQQEAAKVVEQQADMKPIQGPVSERPAFISPMEWSLLQAVAQQHPHPDQKLVNMLNFVRYGKQSEALEAMPKPGEPGKRRALAEALINDLPQRLINGDLDLTGARTDLLRFLEDAEPDAKRREKRLEVEMKRLTAAEDQYKKSEAEKAG